MRFFLADLLPVQNQAYDLFPWEHLEGLADLSSGGLAGLDHHVIYQRGKGKRVGTGQKGGNVEKDITLRISPLQIDHQFTHARGTEQLGAS